MKIERIVDVLSAYPREPYSELEMYNHAVLIREASRKRDPVHRLLIVANVLRAYSLRASMNERNEVDVFGDGEVLLTLFPQGRRRP